VDRPLHVARIDLPEFYLPGFETADEARAFVEQARAIPVDVSPAKRILHQAARMIWLGDRLHAVAASRPALQVLFYLIAAEATAKLLRGFSDEGKSKEHVRLFFEQICSDEHRAQLASGFRLEGQFGTPSIRAVVDLLYAIRCDVVHEGRYFEFQMQEPGEDPCITGVGDQVITVKMSIHDLRQIVLQGAVRAVRQSMEPGGSTG
jgi:hypothetical protein